MSECPECDGAGWIYLEADLRDPKFGAVRRCEICADRERENRVALLWTYAGVPAKWHDCRFGTYQLDLFPTTRLKGSRLTQRESAAEALSAAQRFANGAGPPFLTIMGAPGNGKTHLAASMIRVLCEREITALYVDSGELATKARAIGRDDSVHDYFSYLQRVPVLVLDDVGAEYGSEYVTSVFHGIVDARYRDPQLRTIVISNLTEADLTVRLGARVIDRLVEKGTGVAVVIEAESVRERRPV